MANIPYVIETTDDACREFAANSTGMKWLMAHELGHGINGDCGTPETMLERAQAEVRGERHFIPTNTREYLAHYMGAILFGNPREYAEIAATLKSLPYDETPDSFYDEDERYPTRPELSAALSKWADQLEKAKAIDENGKIIDLEKAINLFRGANRVTIQGTTSTQASLEITN